MAPQLALYILCGCVVASIGLFVVALVIPAMRAPGVRVTSHPNAAGPRPMGPARVMRLDLIAQAVRPPYREGGWRKLYRGFIIVLVPSVIIALVMVAYPPLLDPLCDDYAWFGDHAAAVVRQHARATNNVIAGVLTRR